MVVARPPPRSCHNHLNAPRLASYNHPAVIGLLEFLAPAAMRWGSSLQVPRQSRVHSEPAIQGTPHAYVFIGDGDDRSCVLQVFICECRGGVALVVVMYVYGDVSCVDLAIAVRIDLVGRRVLCTQGCCEPTELLASARPTFFYEGSDLG